MIDLSGNLSLSFGAQYKAEDTASYILYRFDNFSLVSRAVNAERFAHWLGLRLFCAPLFEGGEKQGYGVLCREPQCLYTISGEKLCLNANSAVVEKGIIDSGNYKLYNYALMLLCAHWLFEKTDLGFEAGGGPVQLSFGLDSVESRINTFVTTDKLFCSIEQGVLSKIDNFAQCLIMPKNRFKMTVNHLFAEMEINRNTHLQDKQLSYVLNALSQMFQVPAPFVLQRLKTLNYI